MDKVQKAEALFTGGCNCAQAVFAACADEFALVGMVLFLFAWNSSANGYKRA